MEKKKRILYFILRNNLRIQNAIEFNNAFYRYLCEIASRSDAQYVYVYVYAFLF